MLIGCVNDVNAIANTLETNGDGSPNFSVKLITSPSTDVTRSSLFGYQYWRLINEKKL